MPRGQDCSHHTQACTGNAIRQYTHLAALERDKTELDRSEIHPCTGKSTGGFCLRRGRRPVLYLPGTIVLSDNQQIVRTNHDFLYLRVPSCRALKSSPCSAPPVPCMGACRGDLASAPAADARRISALIAMLPAHTTGVRCCY